MSIPANTTGKVQYTGDGHTRSFPLTFPIYKKTDGLYAISVSVADGLGENATVLTERTDYTVRESGSSFCDVVLNTAPAAGNVLSIIYDNELSQLYKPTDFTRLPAASLISAFDKLTAICIQLSEKLARCAKVDVFSEIQPEELVRRINRIHSSADNIDALAAIKSQITQTSNYIHQVENVGNSIAAVNALAEKLNAVIALYNIGNAVSAVADIVSAVSSVAGVTQEISFIVNHIKNEGGLFYAEYVPAADRVIIQGQQDHAGFLFEEV